MATIPDAAAIRSFLEGYCVTEARLSSSWIEARRDGVISWIESKTRLSLNGEREYIEYLSGTGGKIMFLSRRNISNLVKLEYVTAPGEYAPAKNSIELVAEEGVLRAKDNFNELIYALFPKGTYNIKATYTAGFDDIPEDLVEAITVLTTERILGHLAGTDGGGGSINVDGYTRTYGSRGKYTEARNDLARWGVGILRKYMTSVVGS